MAIYYLRLLERGTNRLRYRYVIEAEDDAGAIRKGEDKITLAPMELHSEGRLVKRWDDFPNP